MTTIPRANSQRGPYRVGSACTGFGGIELAVASLLPVEHIWHCEIDANPSKVLAVRFPGVPNLKDVRAPELNGQRIDWSQVPPVDIFCAGFPCQGVSDAGQRLGVDDERWLFDDLCDALGRMAARPRLLVFENVRGLLTANDGEAMARVVHGLARLGYVGAWRLVRASDVGACHQRARIFIVAHLADDPTPLLWAEGDTRAGNLTAGSASAVHLMPTPRTSDANGIGQHGTGSPDLRTTVSLLPTPNAALGRGAGFPSQETARERMSSGRRFLDDAVALLPTPTARDGKGNNQRGDETCLTGALLPTPIASDGEGGPKRLAGDGRTMTDHGAQLRDVAPALLPTPRVAATRTGRSAMLGSSASPSIEQALEIARGEVPREVRSIDEAPASWRLLPTPRASDTGTAGRRASDGFRPPLSEVILTRMEPEKLLPTPRASDGEKGGPNQRGSSGDLMLPAAVQPDRFGVYAEAVARWEMATGNPVPEPTELNEKGAPRLNPAFAEWMMGLPAGWVTALRDDTRGPSRRGISRNAVLRIVGNGVVWQQAAHGIALCLADLRRSATEVAA